MSTVEDLKWVKFPVLDDGFVCLVDVMGEDSSVVQAARVSYGEGTTHVSDDRTLIRYLMRKFHTTPFEMCVVKLLVRVPMDCWRQWIRHRMSSTNEYSTRYSVAIDSAQRTSPNDWRVQAESNRQGSDGLIDPVPGHSLSTEELGLHQAARRVYQDRLDAGVAREQARKDLPLSTYTEAYWKIDLHNLFHFLRLRMDSHAQEEIRRYAVTIGHEIVKPLFPICWEAFEDYRLNGMFLSALDVRALSALIDAALVPPGESAGNNVELLRRICTEVNSDWDLDKKRCRERDEFFNKISRLGVDL